MFETGLYQHLERAFFGLRKLLLSDSFFWGGGGGEGGRHFYRQAFNPQVRDGNASKSVIFNIFPQNGCSMRFSLACGSAETIKRMLW